MTSKPSNPTSARNIKKSLIKFKVSVPYTEMEIAELRPHVLEWSRLARLAKLSAHDLFEAYGNMDQGEFTQYVQAHPPTPQTIGMLVNIAVAADSPDKPSSLGKMKAEKLFGETKKTVLEKWKAYCNSTNYKSKNHFAQLQAKTLKNANGDPIAPSTIYRWLPKNKNSS